jgi:WD40 repeat protein
VVTDSVYLKDGTVLTVHSDTQNLTVFKDGVQVGTAVLPDSHRYDTQMGYSIQRYVQAGRNGYVVTHLTKLMEPVSATDVAFYDTATGAWFQPELEAPFANPEAYAFAENAPLFAAVDQQNQIRVLNLQSGAQETAFALQLPDNSVLCMDFLMDDSYLMVKTRDAKVLVYEIATGKILLQDQLDTTYAGTLSAQTDPVSQRLYIIDSSLSGVNALCVDLRSWTVLARAEQVLCYVPQTNELMYAQNLYGDEIPQFFCFRVPDTHELVALGQQILEKG